MYIKDSSSIFATDIICAIKDKLSYLLVGTFVGMSDVVIYDLGLKLHGIVAKPYMLICTVMFPRLAKNRSIIKLHNTYCNLFFIEFRYDANIWLLNFELKNRDRGFIDCWSIKVYEPSDSFEFIFKSISEIFK